VIHVIQRDDRLWPRKGLIFELGEGVHFVVVTRRRWYRWAWTRTYGFEFRHGDGSGGGEPWVTQPGEQSL
jgi:hypothetical protein